MIPLTEKDIQNLKDKLSEKYDLSNLTIKDLNVGELIPQSFNGTIISELNGRHCLNLPDGMDQPKFKTFFKSPGGMFARDSLAYMRGKEHGKYLLIEGKGERKIVRLIEDEELLLFQTLKLIKGIVKDKPFMLLRNLLPEEKLSNSERYIKENSEHEEPEEVMAVQPQTAKPEDDHETNATSVSLFDE